MSNSIEEMERATFLFCVGTNMTETHPVMAVRVKKAVRKGARLVVADPRRIRLAEYAARYLPIRPGSDTALFNAMARTIVDEGLVNREFVRERTTGFEELVEHLRPFTPEWAEGITGVPAEDIRNTAIEYARAERSGIYYTLGVTEHVCGVGNVQALCNLALLTGHIGRPGTGVNPLRGQNNIQGAGDCGALPNHFPGFQKVDDPSCRRKMEALWGVPLDGKPGITKIRAMEHAVEGRIRAMWIVGENTAVSDADGRTVERALRNLEFLVVQDIFETETAKYAHVVLPAAAFAEVDGTFTNSERRVQRVRKALEPPGQARPDWWIIGQVGMRMNAATKMDFRSAEEVFDELARVSPIYHGMSYRRLEGRGLQWPCPDPDHPGTPFLHAGKFENGRGILSRVEYIPPQEVPTREFPFVLTTGRRLATYHTNTQTGRSAGFRSLVPHEWLEVNPEDARRLGISTGDWVEVRSRRGEIRVRALVTNRSQPGVAFLSFSFPETRTNVLTSARGDPRTETPELKVTAVSLRRVDKNT